MDKRPAADHGYHVAVAEDESMTHDAYVAALEAFRSVDASSPVGKEPGQ